MIETSLISSLLGSSNSGSTLDSNSLLKSASSEELTIESVTKSLLNTKFNIEQPAVEASFSNELVQYIKDNLDETQAESLLADISAINKLSDSGVDSNDVASQLLASAANKTVDLLA